MSHAQLRLPSVDDHRLLAEHVLARLEAHQDVIAVEGVRRRDVHDLDLRVGGQRLVRRICLREAVLLRELVGRGLRARRACVQHGLGRLLEREREVVADGAGCDDAPLHRVMPLVDAWWQGRGATWG